MAKSHWWSNGLDLPMPSHQRPSKYAAPDAGDMIKSDEGRGARATETGASRVGVESGESLQADPHGHFGPNARIAAHGRVREVSGRKGSSPASP